MTAHWNTVQQTIIHFDGRSFQRKRTRQNKSSIGWLYITSEG